ADEMHVRPRSAAIVEEGGVFTSNYICMKPVKSLQMYPTAYLNGKNSVVSFNTILYAVKDSYIDVGSRVYLRGEGSRADIIARTIAKDKSQIIARGHIIGEIPKVKAHLECRGLLLSDTALIHAIPELEGRAKDVDLSHEAAVGKIAEQEILYLMSRGLTEDEAVAVIIRGFLSVDIKGLPEKLKAEMQKIIDFDMQKML
ncbi:MAG: SufD family Fe-S cluster assembly protein, partial [Candidatus Saganbacteria bacterium]|nr:SufD family Fe-S cluster assembly protein [Candidatus Saganbacteria bacterium]